MKPKKTVKTSSKKLLDTTIKRLNKKIISLKGNEFNPNEFFTAGHCAEFAFALARFSQDKGFSPKVIVLFRDEIESDTGKFLSRTFSHCVTNVDCESFDIKGSAAIEAWKDSFIELEEDYDNGELEMENDWVETDISFSDQSKAYDELKVHCDKAGVPLDPYQIEEVFSLLNSLTMSPVASNGPECL